MNDFMDLDFDYTSFSFIYFRPSWAYFSPIQRLHHLLHTHLDITKPFQKFESQMLKKSLEGRGSELVTEFISDMQKFSFQTLKGSRILKFSKVIKS